MKTSIKNRKAIKKQIKKDYLEAEKLMNEALKWVTCPLGDVKHAIRDFETFIHEWFSTIHQSLQQYFDRLFFTKSNQLLESYHSVDESGFSCYDMDRAFMNS